MKQLINQFWLVRRDKFQMLEAETGLALSLLSATVPGRDLASKLECKEAEALKSLNWSRSEERRIQTSECQTLV